MRKKRGLALFTGAMLLFSSASAQTYAIGKDEAYALVTDAGEIICPMGEYERVFTLTESLFVAEDDGGWLVLGENGEKATDAVYEDIYTQDGFIFLKKDGLWAAADADMRLITQHFYTQMTPNGEGGFLALKTDPTDDRGDGIYLIGADGSETATGTVIVYGLNPFSCARSAAVASGGKKTGYLAPDGTWAITAQYGHGLAFTADGLAAAAADSGAGVIDTDGNWVVSPKFEEISLTDGNCVLAVRTGSGRIGLMNAVTREKIMEIDGENGYVRTQGLRDMALVTMNGVSTLYGADGTVLNEWSADTGASVCVIGEKNLLLSMDGGEYLLDMQAQALAGPYRRIDMAGQGIFAAIKSEGGCELLDEEGSVLLETQYERILPAGGELLLAEGSEGPMLIDKNGFVIVELARNGEAE